MDKYEAFKTNPQAVALVEAAAKLSEGRDQPMTARELLSNVGMEAGQISRVQMLREIDRYPDGEKVKGLLQAMVDACIDTQRKEGKLDNIREEDLPRYKELFAQEFVSELRTSVQLVQQRLQQHSEAPSDTRTASADVGHLVPDNLKEALARAGLGAPVPVSREMVESQNVASVAQRDDSIQRA
jgi:hypothetical protein